MTSQVSPPSFVMYKSTTVAECNNDVVHDQFRLSSSASSDSGIEQASSASRTVTTSQRCEFEPILSPLLCFVVTNSAILRDGHTSSEKAKDLDSAPALPGIFPVGDLLGRNDTRSGAALHDYF
ncbi:hypothetical protein T10_8074 [Trichinella papuae]|uniref:Uncharacterized protein n=1 Tax=Trichinella papuae TaxID=268474 RepID=A0A0V1M1V1_9BILA|nr:hypothetical protein T10_8074 [Trichinella papuae]